MDFACSHPILRIFAFWSVLCGCCIGFCILLEDLWSYVYLFYLFVLSDIAACHHCYSREEMDFVNQYFSTKVSMKHI